MQSVAVRYGAESNPGVDTGTGRRASPPPGRLSSSPVSTTCWQGGDLTLIGAIGPAIARIQASPISADRLPHADRVDFGRGGERADHHRDVVTPALGVGHIGEQEGPPLVLGHAAQELPAHQRVQLGVLVDRPVDAHQKAVGLEIGQMLLEIEPRPAGRPNAGAAQICGLIEHRAGSRFR